MCGVCKECVVCLCDLQGVNVIQVLEILSTNSRTIEHYSSFLLLSKVISRVSFPSWLSQLATYFPCDPLPYSLPLLLAPSSPDPDHLLSQPNPTTASSPIIVSLLPLGPWHLLLWQPPPWFSKCHFSFGGNVNPHWYLSGLFAFKLPLLLYDLVCPDYLSRIASPIYSLVFPSHHSLFSNIRIFFHHI